MRVCKDQKNAARTARTIIGIAEYSSHFAALNCLSDWPVHQECVSAAITAIMMCLYRKVQLQAPGALYVAVHMLTP
jgi:hypothetical protein